MLHSFYFLKVECICIHLYTTDLLKQYFKWNILVTKYTDILILNFAHVIYHQRCIKPLIRVFNVIFFIKYTQVRPVSSIESLVRSSGEALFLLTIDIESNGHLSLLWFRNHVGLVIGHSPRNWRSLVSYPGKPVRWTDLRDMTKKCWSNNKFRGCFELRAS